MLARTFHTLLAGEATRCPKFLSACVVLRDVRAKPYRFSRALLSLAQARTKRWSALTPTRFRILADRKRVEVNTLHLDCMNTAKFNPDLSGLY